MTGKPSKLIELAETNAKAGDIAAIELLARRFFDGKGVAQSFQKSYFWSTIALKKDVTYVAGLNQYALKKLSEEEKRCAEKDLRDWFNHS
jgi:TPR repeat protein